MAGKPKVLSIDEESARWAYRLGCQTRIDPNVGFDEGPKLCPFRPGTPHRFYWMTGWKGGMWLWKPV